MTKFDIILLIAFVANSLVCKGKRHNLKNTMYCMCYMVVYIIKDLNFKLFILFSGKLWLCFRKFSHKEFAVISKE